MADHQPIEGSSMNNVSSGSPESTVELNIKTLDSQIFSFHADKNMQVSAFKEKIASQIGVPVEQQRLIFRGKVLKDDHLLSEYYVENGHTLHLVERQPSQPQPSSSSDNGNTRTNNTGRVGQEPGGPGGSRNRMGQISHSVVLGTFNVGEQGENVGSDLSRVIGAVLNSIGIGSQPGTQPSMQITQRSATEGVRNDGGNQSQGGNQPQPGQSFNSQSMPHAVQIPLGAGVALPSLNMPIPDSLNTIYEFVNRLEHAMSQHGYQPSQSPNITTDPGTTQLPSSPRGVPTPEALSIILRHVQRLLGGHAVAALSHVAGRLEQEAGSNDPTIRGQIQTESVQAGLAMQHLGALLLEIGRNMLTLRMGQSPGESSVNAGPAVYISPSGPNPIMVQPFPLQTSSLFGSPASAPSNPGAFGPVGIGNISRHVNIHIHTGAPLAPFVPGVGARTNNGEGTPGERANGTASGDSAQSRVQGVTNVNATAVPLRPAVVAVSGTLEPSVGPVGVSLPPDLFPLSTVVPEVNSQIRNFVGNIRGGHQASSEVERSTVQERAVGAAAAAGNEGRSNEQNILSGHGLGNINQPFPDVSKMTNQTQPSGHQPSDSKDSGGAVSPKYEPSSSSLVGSNEPSSTPVVVTAEGVSSSSQAMDTPGGSSTTPLGLGLGGLQPKRRSRQSRSQGNTGNSSLVTSNQTEHPRIAGQQVLQSLLAARGNGNTQASGQLAQPAGVVVDTLPPAEENADGQFDIGNAMSQVLQSPALNGLLAGVSQQTGIGSPNALRNIMEQLTQNPAMQNTVNQIAQQIDNHDLGNMFSSLGGGQGGGFDLSRMMQQMMPIVSQALGGVSTGPQPMLAMGPGLMGSRSRRDVSTVENSQSDQIDIQQVARGIEQQSPPGEIFRSMVENAVQLCEGGNVPGNVVDELCSDEGLANEFMEMLQQDISRQIGDRSSP